MAGRTTAPYPPGSLLYLNHTNDELDNMLIFKTLNQTTFNNAHLSNPSDLLDEFEQVSLGVAAINNFTPQPVDLQIINDPTYAALGQLITDVLFNPATPSDRPKLVLDILNRIKGETVPTVTFSGKYIRKDVNYRIENETFFEPTSPDFIRLIDELILRFSQMLQPAVQPVSAKFPDLAEFIFGERGPPYVLTYDRQVMFPTTMVGNILLPKLSPTMILTWMKTTNYPFHELVFDYILGRVQSNSIRAGRVLRFVLIPMLCANAKAYQLVEGVPVLDNTSELMNVHRGYEATLVSNEDMTTARLLTIINMFNREQAGVYGFNPA